MNVLFIGGVKDGCRISLNELWPFMRFAESLKLQVHSLRKPDKVPITTFTTIEYRLYRLTPEHVVYALAGLSLSDVTARLIANYPVAEEMGQ